MRWIISRFSPGSLSLRSPSAFPVSRFSATSYVTIDGEDATCTPTNGGGRRTFRDVAATEALFTSLLVQSHAALRSEAAKAPPGSRTRSRSFRSSFLLSFVARIDERLREVTAHVEFVASSMQGAALLPALVDRENAVEDSVTELFGTLEGVAVRAGTDAAGWARGRIAADLAHLTAGDVTAPLKRLGGAA